MRRRAVKQHQSHFIQPSPKISAHHTLLIPAPPPHAHSNSHPSTFLATAYGFKTRVTNESFLWGSASSYTFTAAACLLCLFLFILSAWLTSGKCYNFMAKQMFEGGGGHVRKKDQVTSRQETPILIRGIFKRIPVFYVFLQTCWMWSHFCSFTEAKKHVTWNRSFIYDHVQREWLVWRILMPGCPSLFIWSCKEMLKRHKAEELRIEIRSGVLYMFTVYIF